MSKPEEATDESLMLAYRGGDVAAFEVLYGRYKGPLYRYFLRQCGNAATAEELFQDLWIKLVNARARYEVKAKFSTWLFHMAHNRLIDHYRRKGNSLPVSYEDDPESEALDDPAAITPERAAGNREAGAILLTLIEALPEAQREAFLMKEEGGMELAEIAAATGVNMETAKSRVRYAVNKLRQGLQARGIEL